eukprot:1156517-Pelagomonas_calceolata.AAC.2
MKQDRGVGSVALLESRGLMTLFLLTPQPAAKEKKRPCSPCPAACIEKQSSGNQGLTSNWTAFNQVTQPSACSPLGS